MARVAPKDRRQKGMPLAERTNHRPKANVATVANVYRTHKNMEQTAQYSDSEDGKFLGSQAITVGMSKMLESSVGVVGWSCWH